MFKTCKQCGCSVFPHARPKFCDACRRERKREQNRAFQSSNKARRAAQVKAWRVANPEHFKAYRAKHYAENKPHYQAQIGAWARANPQAIRTIQHKRRARLAGSNSPGVTPEQWAEIVETFGGCCAYCLQPCSALERDHVIPIARGGLDEPGNVVPACERCNCSKNAAILPVWFARQLNAGLL